MKLQRPQFPQNTDADLVLAVVGENLRSAVGGSPLPLKESFVFSGVHERTSKGDAVSVSASSSSRRHQVKYRFCRDSLYHILPEYLFHPLDRYADCEGDSEEFHRCREQQLAAENDALEFFYFWDREYQQMRAGFQTALNERILDSDRFLADFMARPFDVDRNNRFIASALKCLPLLRGWRGDINLIRKAVSVAFGPQLISMESSRGERQIDFQPNECHSTLDGELDMLFAAPSFAVGLRIMNVKVQTQLRSESEIAEYAKLFEGFAGFMKSWFLAQDDEMEIEFGDFRKLPVMTVGSSDGDLFLNYNTQLI